MVDPWSLATPGLSAVGRDVVAHVLRRAAGGHTVERELVLAPPSAALLHQRILPAIDPDAVAAADREWLHGRTVQIARHQLRLDVAATDAVQVLRSADIASRVLKGVASAHLDYASPVLRHSGDVDIAVPSGALRDAVSALESAGSRTLLPGYVAMPWTRGVTMVAPSGIHLDLHNRLFDRSPRHDVLFEPAGDPIDQLGDAVGLPAEWRYVHAAVHWLLTSPSKRRATGLVDVVTIANTHDLDHDEVARFARAQRVESALNLAREIVDALVHDRPAVLEVDASRGGSSRLERLAFLRDGPLQPLAAAAWHHGPRLVVRGPVAAARFGWRRLRRIELESEPPSEPNGSHLRDRSVPTGGRLVVVDGVRSRQVGADLVLHAADSGHTVVLDGPGRELWQSLPERPFESAELVQQILDEYAAVETDVVRDVDVLLSQLVEAGLVAAAPTSI